MSADVPGRDSCSAAKFIHLIGDWGAIGRLMTTQLADQSFRYGSWSLGLEGTRG
jgi:hypothetical protein